MILLRVGPTLWVLGAYAVVLAILLPLRPFWLDEILQLVGTRPEATLREVIAYVPQNPGGVPLGYLIQHWWLEVAGVGRWAARLPAAVFGILAVAGVALLGRKLGLRRPWVAAALFAAWPLMIRYSAEARPYSQGVFLGVAATLVFLRLRERPGVAWAAAYAALLVAAVYTQPFVLFVAGGLTLWAAWTRDWRLSLLSGGAAALAALSFIPWLVFSRAGWNATIADAQFQFVWTWKTPLMLFREISGSGYWGSGLLLIACVAGWRRGRLATEARALLGFVIAACVLGGLAADATFSYFVAIRQFLWIIPPAAILAAAGLEALNGRTAAVLAAAFLMLAAYKTVQYFGNSREDWPAASVAISKALDASGGCFTAAPPSWTFLYEFVEPGLATRRCGTGSAPAAVVAAVSSYTPAAEMTRMLAEWTTRGYAVAAQREAGGTRVLTLQRQ